MTTIDDLYKQRCLGLTSPNSAMAKHLSFLKQLVIEHSAKQVVEIGVCTGQSTIAFLAGLQETGGELWSVDIEMPRPPINQYLNHPIWNFVLGSSWYNVYQAPKQIDILFVDGAFENRLVDMEIYGAKVRDGGYILVHDTEQEIVQEQIGWYLTHKPYSYRNVEKGHGLGVIRKKL